MKKFPVLIVSAVILSCMTALCEESSPIFKAAESDNYKEMKKLLKDGANPNQKNEWGGTPLFIASEKGYFNIVTLLVNSGADTNLRSGENEWTPIFAAVERKRPDIVEILLQHGANVNAKDSKGWTPLHLAARNGLEYISSILLMNKAEVNAKDNAGWTPLHEAARHGNAVIVKLLMRHHADPEIKDKRGKTPIDLARDTEIRDLLMRKNPEKHIYKGSDLIKAVKNNDYGKTHIILNHYKVDVNSKDEKGKTALHYAVEKGFSELVKLLLSHKADKTIKDNSGKSPLDLIPNQTIDNILNPNNTVSGNNRKSPVKMESDSLDNILDPNAGKTHINDNRRQGEKRKEDIDQKEFKKDFKGLEKRYDSGTNKEKKEFQEGMKDAENMLRN